MIEKLMDSVRPLRQRLIDHPIYHSIDSPEALRCFMELHVFAVWDFMTLLKALQRPLTCVTLPWTPTPNREARRLINEIVLAEESDDDGEGSYASHFESYLDAMRDAGANIGPITRFIELISAGHPVERALEISEAPDEACAFVASTWEFVQSESLPAIAAAFTVGREDLIPDLFRGLVVQVTANDPVRYHAFLRYLDRHVSLDGDEHGPMALNLLTAICGTDPIRWRDARFAATLALDSRWNLWEGVVREISQAHAS